MPAIFKIDDDKFRFDSLLFSGGKHRITLNGHSVYEGEMSEQSPAQFTASGKDYEVAKIKNH